MSTCSNNLCQPYQHFSNFEGKKYVHLNVHPTPNFLLLHGLEILL